MTDKNQPGTFRRASVSTNLFGGLLHYKECHDWATWVFGMLFFKEDIGVDTIDNIVNERLLTIPRFRSRYDLKKKGFYEIDLDTEYDKSYHVRVVEHNMDLRTIRNEYCGDVYKHMDFDPDKPLWQLTYFPNLEDGRSLLITTINHAIGDGMAMIEILFRLLDKPSATKSVDDLRPAQKRSPPKSTFGPLNRLRINIGGLFSPLADVFGAKDSRNPLTRENLNETGVKKMEFTEKIPIEKVKDLKEKFGATLNDILVALLTLTVNAYFDELEEETKTKVVKKGQQVRMGFGIDLRKRGEDPFRDGSPHNHVAQGLIKLYLKPTSKINLVWKVKRQLDRIKLSPGPVVQIKVANAISMILPLSAKLKVFTDFQSATTSILSNVAGPQDIATLAGFEVDDLQFLAYAPAGSYLGLLSYNGFVSCGISIDENTNANPEDIAKHWKTEFDLLYDECTAYEGRIPKPTGFRAKLDKL